MGNTGRYKTWRSTGEPKSHEGLANNNEDKSGDSGIIFLQVAVPCPSDFRFPVFPHTGCSRAFIIAKFKPQALCSKTCATTHLKTEDLALGRHRQDTRRPRTSIHGFTPQSLSQLCVYCPTTTSTSTPSNERDARLSKGFGTPQMSKRNHSLYKPLAFYGQRAATSQIIISAF
ncbi:hypothetical protein BDV18DRAFT_8441 [Aspergillus unguis]